MGHTQVKELRDELARVIASEKRWKDAYEEQVQTVMEMRGQMAEMRGQMAEMRVRITEQEMVISKMGKSLKFYENPHTPPSQGSIPERKRRAEQRKDPSERKSPGRKKGHEGVSHHVRATTTAYRKPEKCHNCGSARIMQTERTDREEVWDIPAIPRMRSVAYVTSRCLCEDCGATTGAREDPAGIPGTNIGPNIMQFLVGGQEARCSLRSMRNLLGFFGMNLSKAAIQHGLDAGIMRMMPSYEGIRADMAHSTCGKGDETPMPIDGRTGYAWAIITDREVLIVISPSRSAAVFALHWPHTSKPFTADGYTVYRICKILQRCWAHMLRDSRDAAEKGGPEMESLHRMLQEAFAEAKELQKLPAPGAESHPAPGLQELPILEGITHSGTGPGRPDLDRAIALLECRIMAIVDRYESEGHASAAKVRNAAPNLFTFVRYPGMDPTNNESERILRWLVLYRRSCQGARNEKGMGRIGTMFTCMMTWRKRGLDPYEMLQKVFGRT